MDEGKTHQERINEASAEYKSKRDQILALKSLSGFGYLIDYFESVERSCMREFTTASLETDTDKKNMFVIRGQYTIVNDFLTYLKNLEASKERDIAKSKKIVQQVL